MKAVIMAGGQGTRIRSVASDIPKSMIPVEGHPVLEYQIENLKRCGITDIILVTGYLRESIEQYFGDGALFGVDIEYFNEDSPMGTAGALFYLKERLSEDFLLLMGDLMLSVDFGRFIGAHKASGMDVTLFVHPNSHPADSDIIVTDEGLRIDAYTENICGIGVPLKTRSSAEPGLTKPVTGVIGKKEIRPAYIHNQVNAGIYALSAAVVALVPEPAGGRVDLDRDIIRPLITGHRVCAYSSSEYVRDMGTPERYDEVKAAVRSGLAEHRNLGRRQRCVFLDRDGTINVYKGLISDPGCLELIDKAAQAVRRLNASEYLVILITNQPVIARGEVSLEEYDEIEKCLETLLGREGAYLDAAYFCPHHGDKGFAGEVSRLKFRCRCRKPEPGLIEEAAKRYNIDLSSSWMIGDMTADIALGERAGVRTIALKTGLALSDRKYEVQPDLVAADLAGAVDMILGEKV